MNNRKYIDTKNYNNSQPSIGDALKGRGGDTEMRPVNGEESHVNLMEAYILDQTRRDGIPQIGEGIVKELGSGTTNPNTGKPEYAMADIGGFMTSAAGMMTGGAAATTGAVLGPAGLVLMGADLIKGAADAAKVNRDKMKELGAGIGKINEKRIQLGEHAREDISNIWEGVGSKLGDIRAGIGSTFEKVSDKVGDVIQRGRGLATGDAEQMVAETTTNVQDILARQTENLKTSATKEIDLYGRKMEDETESITMEIQDMQSEIAGLEKKSKWYQNII